MARHQLIHIHPEAPAKPAFGQPCNGCGVCCLAEPCPIGIVVSRKTRGACAALVWSEDQRRYHCGLLTRPHLRWLQPLLRRWISAGSGCDATLETETPAR